jgi:hypothetical protein
VGEAAGKSLQGEELDGKGDDGISLHWAEDRKRRDQRSSIGLMGCGGTGPVYSVSGR